MKRIFLVSILSCIAFNLTFSQDLKMSFVPYYADGDTVKSFERIGAIMEYKAIGFGYGGVNTYYTVFDSPNSIVRFSNGSIPKFFIKVDEGSDIVELVVITKADVTKREKNYRRFVKAGLAMFGGAKDMSKYCIIPVLTKLKDNIYEISFPDLMQGEYAFMPIMKGAQSADIMSGTGKYMIYCFGID